MSVRYSSRTYGSLVNKIDTAYGNICCDITFFLSVSVLLLGFEHGATHMLSKYATISLQSQSPFFLSALSQDLTKFPRLAFTHLVAQVGLEFRILLHLPLE